MSKPTPSIDAWLKEAKTHESAPMCGMYLTHNGTVRQTAKAKVRYGAEDTKEVTGMLFSYDPEKVDAVIVKKGGEPMIYKTKDYTMVVAIDCVKIGFVFRNGKKVAE